MGPMDSPNTSFYEGQVCSTAEWLTCNLIITPLHLREDNIIVMFASNEFGHIIIDFVLKTKEVLSIFVTLQLNSSSYGDDQSNHSGETSSRDEADDHARNTNNLHSTL